MSRSALSSRWSQRLGLLVALSLVLSSVAVPPAGATQRIDPPQRPESAATVRPNSPQPIPAAPPAAPPAANSAAAPLFGPPPAPTPTPTPTPTPEPAPVLTVTLTVTPTTAAPGEPVTLQVSAANLGPGPAAGVVFSMTLPSAVEYQGPVGDAPGLTYDPVRHGLTWRLGSVPAGAGGSFACTLQVAEGAMPGEHRFAASLTAEPPAQGAAAQARLWVELPPIGSDSYVAFGHRSLRWRTMCRVERCGGPMSEYESGMACPESGAICAIVLAGLLGIVLGWKALRDPDHSPPPYDVGRLWVSGQLRNWVPPYDANTREYYVARVKSQGLFLLVCGAVCLLLAVALAWRLGWFGGSVLPATPEPEPGRPEAELQSRIAFMPNLTRDWDRRTGDLSNLSGATGVAAYTRQEKGLLGMGGQTPALHWSRALLCPNVQKGVSPVQEPDPTKGAVYMINQEKWASLPNDLQDAQSFGVTWWTKEVERGHHFYCFQPVP